MNTAAIIAFANVICVGLLAGEEFAMCYGIRTPIARLDDQAHIRARQALIYRLRVLVPGILALTMLSGIAATVANGTEHGFALRCAGLLVLVTFIGITLGGTVPINKAALAWNPAAPPANWRALVSRWENLNTARCWLAVAAFALAAIALL